MKPRVLVLAKRTSFQTFALDRKDPRTLELLRTHDPSVQRMRASHDSHEATVVEVRAALDKLGARVTFHIGPEKPFSDRYDLVVTVGGDGTLLTASHRIGSETPLLGINGSPKSSVGFFCAAVRETAADVLARALDDDLPRTRLSRMQVELDGELLHHRILNDALFCHASPAATSRYILTLRSGPRDAGRVVEQRSSGVWIGPAAGSTAAQRSAGGKVLPLRSTALQFVVREPYVRDGKRDRLVRGLVRPGGELELRSKIMDGRVYLDGVHTMHPVGLGQVIRFRRSPEDLTVLGLRGRARL